MTIISLIRPNIEGLPAYEDALRRGWSPNTTRNVSGEQIALLDKLRHAPARFLYETYESPTIRMPDGSEMERLPAHDFWISDGEFCGRLNFRFLRGTEELPPHVSGHIGYSVVPWKRRLGCATQALRLVLPVARSEGLSRVLVTCDDDNVGSQKVILANGGVFAGETPHETRAGHVKLNYWVPTLP
ncbi:GNAT family N-acetyltransferase [Microvirga flavescens]|uniref:GNAT family N-acetyltransferase n=1 Tax=Microvirga flavescens TaxID=2249811 RepID=UPI000DD6EF9F|nr:GNAT family N-acetyltransferase [Microvirga flavescens]